MQTTIKKEQEFKEGYFFTSSDNYIGFSSIERSQMYGNKIADIARCSTLKNLKISKNIQKQLA